MRKKTTEEFINEAREIYGDEYDYSKTNYERDNVKVCITCKIHGDFYKTPSNHLHKTNPQGCPYCAREKLSKRFRSDLEDVINRCKIKHNYKYNYSKVKYINGKEKVCIICPIHGDFWQTTESHLNGCGCPKCAYNMPLTQKEYIRRASIKHNFKYDYSVTTFTRTEDKVAINCPFHGIFYQLAEHHLQGCGCPKCKSSHMEIDIRNLLVENDIKFEEQKRFSWLGGKSLDFYIPSKNVAIECQGRQHFEPIDFFGGVDKFKEETKRDKEKKKQCMEHNVRLLYYANFDYNFPYEVFTDKNKLITEIDK